MDKKKIILPLLIILTGILLILSGGFVNEFIVVPNPDKLIEVMPCSPQDDSDIVYLTDNDVAYCPEFCSVLESGGGILRVYSSDTIPDGGISTEVADRILMEYTGYLLSYNGETYVLSVVHVSYAMSPAEIAAAALKIFGWVPIFAGAVLCSVNFVRSVAQSPRRLQIQQYIKENPGCSEADVVKNIGHSRNSTVHHIQKLIRENKIRETAYHKTVRYYSADNPETETDTINAARTKEKPAVILSALERKSMTVSELEAETGISAASLRWYLAKLEEDGIVSSEKIGHTIYYSMSE